MNIGSLLPVVFYSCVLAGCSLVMTDPTQSITVKTDPPGADCALARDGEEIGRVNPTPGDISVYRNGHDLSVLCKKADYQDGATILKADIAVSTFTNVLALDPLRIGLDAVSGANHVYPGVVNIGLLPAFVARPSGANQEIHGDEN